MLQLNTSNCSIKDFKSFKNTSLPQNVISSTRIYLLKPCYLMTPSSWNFDNMVTASMLHQDCFKITSRLLQDFFKSTSLNLTVNKCLDDICPRNFLLVIIFTLEILHILAVTDLILPNHKVRIMWLNLQLNLKAALIPA